MRGLFSFVGLLVVLLIVGGLVRKQFTAGGVPSVTAPVPGTPIQPGQPIPQQIKQTVEDAMQQARPMPDDKP